jgi:hypothetical protein
MDHKKGDTFCFPHKYIKSTKKQQIKHMEFYYVSSRHKHIFQWIQFSSGVQKHYEYKY